MSPIQYTVKGHWPFPVDMLRRDSSCAATPSDQEKIDLLSQDHAPDREAFMDVEINLVGPNRPNTARWESFGWSVPSDHEYAAYQECARQSRLEQMTFDAAMAKLTPEERKVVLARIETRH